MLLSALVETFGISRMRDFFTTHKHLKCDKIEILKCDKTFVKNNLTPRQPRDLLKAAICNPAMFIIRSCVQLLFFLI